MKRIIVISGLALVIGLFHACRAGAQGVSVHVDINIDRQPAWGPTGYDYAAFYYFPELNVYFDIDRALFYYLSGRKWVSGFYLPLAYHRYDLYQMYKVVLNREPNPWIHNRLHRRDYARFSQNHSQEVIRHAQDRRYSRARSNTRAWVEPEHGRTDRDKRKDSHRSNDRRDQKDRNYAKPPSNQNRSGQSGRSAKPDTEKERSRNNRSTRK
ncbi:MAG: hypothetical protein LBK22_10260 [Tannerella sp.]|jgi:hypothetical protein|nr:hypothetical protein [Tannerella sp.]